MSDKISIFTSCYRGAQHLPNYIAAINETVHAVAQQGIPIEVIFIANDPTPQEQVLFPQLDARYVTVHEVPRESLYASWNRGVELATGACLGPWNVDDTRTAEGLVAAYHAFSQGAELVDTPYMVHVKGEGSELRTRMYNPTPISPKNCPGAFFMFHRKLYDKAGPFDGRFRASGDFEWGTRPAVRAANVVYLDGVGGHFYVHGGNLSNGNNEREWVEINTILLWHQQYIVLRPVNPQFMHDLWEDWGHTGAALPQDVADWLWGDGAEARYAAYTRERNAAPLVRRARLALAQRGLLPSVELQIKRDLEHFQRALSGDA